MKCKHLLLATIAIAVTSTLSAQVNKGDILLGATFGSGYNRTSSPVGVTSSSNANLSPRIAFGVGNNSLLGARLEVGYGRGKTEGSDTRNINFNYGASIFWRKLMPLSKQIGWYLEPTAGVSYVSHTQKLQNSKPKSSSMSFIAGAVPGIYYQPLPRLLINADFGGLTFIQETYKSTGGTKTRNTGVDLSLLRQFTFGIDFILGKKA